MMPGRQNDEVELKVGYMVKRSQGKSTLGATNFKKRVFSLTSSRLSYYDGTLEVGAKYIHVCVKPNFLHEFLHYTLVPV